MNREKDEQLARFVDEAVEAIDKGMKKMKPIFDLDFKIRRKLKK